MLAIFLNNGITIEGAAWLLGNLQDESAVRPEILEKSKQRKLSLTSEEQMRKVNDGTYKNFFTIGTALGQCNGLINKKTKFI